jgi:cytochrome c
MAPRHLSAVLASIMLLGASTTQAQESLALEKGCFTCHGNPPKKNAPTFKQLATAYAKYQGQSDAAARLANELTKGHIFGGIKAHETLTPESALLLIHWIIAGAN